MAQAGKRPNQGAGSAQSERIALQGEDTSSGRASKAAQTRGSERPNDDHLRFVVNVSA